ncbi:MAG: type II secretion system protein J [Candidatus Brocadiia bacterium]
MKVERTKKGFTLPEVLAWMFVGAIILTMIGPLFARGLGICGVSRNVLHAIQSSEIIFSRLSRDIRCADNVRLSEKEKSDSDEGWAVLVSFSDELAAAYVVRDGAVIRCEIPPNTDFPADGVIPEEWYVESFNRGFKYLRVSAAENAQRLYHLEVGVDVHSPIENHGLKTDETAVFSTAVCIRKEEFTDR